MVTIEVKFHYFNGSHLFTRIRISDLFQQTFHKHSYGCLSGVTLPPRTPFVWNYLGSVPRLQVISIVTDIDVVTLSMVRHNLYCDCKRLSWVTISTIPDSCRVTRRAVCCQLILTELSSLSIVRCGTSVVNLQRDPPVLKGDYANTCTPWT